MRMLFLVVLLIIPGMARAVNSDCRQITGQNAQTTCENTAGCHWVNKCLPCQEDHYCPGNNNAQILCSSIGTGFNWSDEGAESMNECYQSTPCYKPNSATETEQCRHYYNNPDITHCNGTITLAHMEGESCYANTRECKLFGIANDSCSNANEVSGNATWYRDDDVWSVSNCECGASPFTDSQTRFCSGTQSGVQPTGNNTTVAYATSPINYTGGTSTGYRCKRCIPDNGNNRYYASNENGDGCVANLQSGTVCKCETSNYRGHYRKGICCTSTTECQEWTNASNICVRVACDIPGTTTNDLLPVSNNNSVCVYSAQTELRDSDEFTLGTLQQRFGLDPAGWKWVNP